MIDLDRWQQEMAAIKTFMSNDTRAAYRQADKEDQLTPIMVLVLCMKRQLVALVEEFDDWQNDGMQIKLYGITEKANTGFILLKWSIPIPDCFSAKLQRDEDIIDVLTFDALFRPASVSQEKSC